MAPRNVGLNSTFNEQRLVINALSVDLDNLSNAGFLTASNLVGYATQGYVNSSIVGFITSGALSGYATQGYVTNSLVGYTTQGYVDTQIGIRTFSGNYNDLTNKPYIPVNINDLSDVNAGGPSTGQVLKWSGSEWQAASDLTASGAGIGLSDLSVTIASPGISSLSYSNVTGVFLFTPTDLTGYATTSSIVGFVTTGALSGYATEGYVNNQGFVTSGIVVGYATEGYVNNAVVGFITSGSSGSNLTGIVTYITAGSGTSVDQNTGNVTITVTSSPYSTSSGYAEIAGISTSAGTATTATNLSDAANIVTGTINKDRISTTNGLTVLGDLYVSNNISFGGTTTQLNTQQLQIVDPDIVLGIGTTFNSNDNTANHGGIAIASTEGTPLVDLNIVPAETNPSTYKKIMWFKGSTIGSGITDAWLFNYGVGIGSTQVPNGVRLAAGGMQVSDSTISSPQLSISGVSTFTNGPLLIGSATSTGTASQLLQVTGGAYVSGNLGIGTVNPSVRLHLRGSGELASFEVPSASSTYFSFTSQSTKFGYVGSASGFITTGNRTDLALRSDNNLLFSIGNAEKLRLNSSGNFLIGSSTSTGTASQLLQVTGGAYLSGNLGVGVTNPASRIDVYSPTSGSTAIRATSGPNYSANLYPGVISGLSTNGASANGSQFVAAGIGVTSGELGVYAFYPTFANFPTDKGPRRAVDLVGGFSTGVWGTEYFSINVGKNGSDNDAGTLTNERLRVDGSGNVGIATANPSTKLHVVGDSTVSGVTNLNQVTETVVNAFNTTLAPSTGTLTVDTSQGTVVLGDLNASVTTWAFTNVPTANSKATTITLIIDGDTAQTYGDACSVNGSAITNGVKWSGGSAPTATNNFDIITFTIVKDNAGNINVFGSGNTNFS